MFLYYEHTSLDKKKNALVLSLVLSFQTGKGMSLKTHWIKASHLEVITSTQVKETKVMKHQTGKLKKKL